MVLSLTALTLLGHVLKTGFPATTLSMDNADAVYCAWKYWLACSKVITVESWFIPFTNPWRRSFWLIVHAGLSANPLFL